MSRSLLAGLMAAGLLLVVLPASAQPPGFGGGFRRGPGGPPHGGRPDRGDRSSDDSADEGDKSGEDSASSEDEKGSESKEGENKEEGEESPKTIERPDKPGFVVDPNELNVKPVNGKVRFNFQGQPWLGVLKWLASITGKSLDWQELPDDYLNLRTQRPYTIAETRDLINRHLLARGYTMLVGESVLRVVKLEGLDPALVPFVSPEKLAERGNHEFVQTIFQLDWIPSTTAEKEFKPLLSPNGTLNALTTTNRLYAMDVVTNLVAVRDLLAQEQSDKGQTRLVKSFPLQYARAEDVKAALVDLLDLKNSGSAGGDERESRMQRNINKIQEKIKQMARQKGGGAAKAGGEEKTSIIANPRKNAIIATAPPETMQVIEQTVKLIDTPANYEGSLFDRLDQIHAYPLTRLNAEALVEMLRSLGGLSPTTKLTIDDENNSLIVNGPPADHMVVQRVIKKLDGSQRQFYVYRLHRLPADYVAGTIRFMKGKQEEEEDSGWGRWWRDDEEEQEDPSEKFRVAADVANNMLLIYATSMEMEEIQGLLVKLGEVRPSDRAGKTVRVLNLTPEQTDVFLKKLKIHWGANKTRPLIIDPSLMTPEEADDQNSNSGNNPEQGPQQEPQHEEATEKTAPPASAIVPTSTTSDPAGRPAASLERHWPVVAQADEASEALRKAVQEYLERRKAEGTETGANGETPESSENDAQQAPDKSMPPSTGQMPAAPVEDPFTKKEPAKPVPVHIERAPGGGLVIRSEDPKALQAIQEMAYQYAPEPKGYHIITLKYPTTVPYYVVLNLEAFFGLNEGEENRSPFARIYYFDDVHNDNSNPALTLGNRRELKFIPDPDSRTILVQGATTQQWKTIQDLVKIYDKPPARNPSDARVTKIFYLKSAKASTVAEAIKEVYRDLLSQNDKAFQRGGDDHGRGRHRRSYSWFSSLMGDDSEPADPITFKGLLSIGVDEESNTLVVSASAKIIQQISRLIESLDGAARREKSVSVVRTGTTGVPPNLAERLKNVFGDKIHFANAEPKQGTTADSQTEPVSEKSKPVSEKPKNTTKSEVIYPIGGLKALMDPVASPR